MLKLTPKLLIATVLAVTLLASLPSRAATNDVVGIGISGSNNHVYYFYRGGKVSSGTTCSPEKYRRTYHANYPPPKKVIAVGISKNDNGVYYWYRDGTVSAGTTDNAEAIFKASPANLPSDKKLIAVGIAATGGFSEKDHVYYWWSDGTVSSGIPGNPTHYRYYYKSNQPAGKSLIGVGIAAGQDDHVYYFYSDGTVSAGTTNNPQKYRTYYRSGLGAGGNSVPGPAGDSGSPGKMPAPHNRDLSGTLPMPHKLSAQNNSVSARSVHPRIVSTQAGRSATFGAMNKQMETDTDRLGGDYRSIRVAMPSPALCRNACAGDSRCHSWTYVKPGIKASQAVCYLKKAVPPPRHNTCCVSGVK